MEIGIPELPKKCRICNHEKKFEIQKSLDTNVPKLVISKEYNIPLSTVNSHIENQHRETLIAFGVMDYTIRKKAVKVGETLVDYIEKWSAGVTSRMPETIKDSDALKAMELYTKIEGNIVNKHEITVKRSIEDALQEFLGDEAEHTETEKVEDVKIEEPKAGI